MARIRSLLIASDGELTVERDRDRPSGRMLMQDGMQASYVDLADAGHLEFDYLRWARIVLGACGARDVLHIGGAGCTLPRALLVQDPSTRHTVIEVDQRVIEVARLHLGLRSQPGLRIRVQDGREALASQADGSFDAVVIDAFIGARVPRHLASAEALQAAARVAPLTLVNVADTGGLPDARAIMAGLGEAYPNTAALAYGFRRGGQRAAVRRAPGAAA